MNAIMKQTPIQVMAERLKIDPDDMQNIIIRTIMPAKVNVTNEQFVSFLAVANEYKLNPLSKEVYAFPAKGGGIQPIVSIDGWLKIINNHKAFDGMSFEFSTTTITIAGKKMPEWCKCMISRKDRSTPIEFIEYMEECYRNTDTWAKKPRRMLQHKTLIQCARYAFGLSGIIDEDEAKSYEDAGVINMHEKVVNHQDRFKPKPDLVDNATGEIIEIDAADIANKMEMSESADELNRLLPELKQVPPGTELDNLRKLYKAKIGSFQHE